MRGNAARALLPALAVLALVGVVAVAATGTTETGSGESRAPATTLLDVLFSLGIVAVAFGGILLLYGLTQRQAIANEIAKHGRFKLMYPTFIGFMALLVVGAYYHFRNWEQKEQIDEVGERVFPNELPPEAAPGDEITTYEPSLAWIPIAVVVGLALLAVVAYVVADRRRRGTARTDEELAGELAVVLDDTLDDLRAEADPRRAVIAAYARLERVLAAHGLARRPAQTPDEYLASVLEQLEVGDRSARRLTSLFAEAKFSQHEVDGAMKDEAIEALVSVRDDLRRVAETPAETVALPVEGQPRMRSDLGAPVKLVAVATLAMLGVVAFAPGRVELALRIFALLLACVGIGLALSALRRAYPRPSPRVGGGAEQAERPASLARLEHVVSLGVAGAFDFHHRLLPRLRALATGLLPARRRVSPADADQARRALGDETWDLVRPDRPPPEDRLARGIPVPELERAVTSLERL